LAARQLTNLFDEALRPIELKATRAALLTKIEMRVITGRRCRIWLKGFRSNFPH
jgi:hypothetical protein